MILWFIVILYLTLKLKRCIDTNLIEVDKSRIDIIRSLALLTSLREVHSFLGHPSFYHRFIKDFPKIALPLYNLLQKDVTFDFNERCQIAFEKLKDVLTWTLVIQPPNQDLPLEVMCECVSNFQDVAQHKISNMKQMYIKEFKIKTKR